MLESGLQAKNIIQVSMDGPSVNWKFYGELKKNVYTDWYHSFKHWVLWSAWVNRPKNTYYEVVKECLKDPCFEAKLHFFKCIANQLQPFLGKLANLCYHFSVMIFV